MGQPRQEQESVPIASQRRPRRRHPIAEKLAIVRECLRPGTSLAGVALAHRVNANMVRKWVVKYQQGGYGQSAEATTRLLPVVVKTRSVTRMSSKKPNATSSIEVELARGVLRLQGPIDRTLLGALIEALSV
jgi:transposase